MRRVLLSLIWVFAFALVCSAQTTFYFPQVANGLQSDGRAWTTTIFITNPSSSSAVVSGQIRFTATDGTAFNIAFRDSAGNPAGSGNMIPFDVAGGQTRKFVSSGQGDLNTGYGVVTTSTGSVTGTALFSQLNGATLVGEAGVPAANLVQRQAIFVDETSGFATAVAYVNPSASAGTVTLQLLNTEGTAVVQSTTRNLGGGNPHDAAFVNGLFANVGGTTGTLQITSSQPVAAIALRFSASGPFTTLPPVNLASLINSGVRWLEKSLPSPLATFARVLGKLQAFRIG